MSCLSLCPLVALVLLAELTARPEATFTSAHIASSCLFSVSLHTWCSSGNINTYCVLVAALRVSLTHFLVTLVLYPCTSPLIPISPTPTQSPVEEKAPHDGSPLGQPNARRYNTLTVFDCIDTP
ncbi:hypothetical protein B0H14DRAFT_675573 [Mycena olivaceomarginata]|nr:hypothetical protein B0H14DRAFT_675573 [Mycena olivaceomarginata]